MNVSAISNATILGRVLRLPLRLIPRNAVVPIVQGRLRGRRWIVGSHIHGCWLGTYEHEKQRAFVEAITPGSVVFDLGAHVGYYSLLASALTGPEGRVFAFEPSPRNLGYLREHLRLNKVSNVTVIDAAVSDSAGFAFFDPSPCNAMGCLADSGPLRVRTVTLDELTAAGELPAPDFIKVDVEGAERRVLAGARGTIERWKPAIFLATHGPEVHGQCCEFLRALGYDLRSLDAKPVETASELLAFHPSRPLRPGVSDVSSRNNPSASAQGAAPPPGG